MTAEPENRDRSRAPSEARDGSRARALAIVLGCSLLTVLWAARWQRAYYQEHLVPGDGAGTYYLVGLTLQQVRAEGSLAALRFAMRSHLYALHQAVAALLAPILPLDLSVGPLLNGVWHVGMSLSVCWLFLEYTRSPISALLLSLPPTLLPSLLASPHEGLTNLHTATLSYTLGTTLICLILLSERLTRPLPTLLAGIWCGLILVGRYPTAALLAVMLAPLIGSILVISVRQPRAARGIAVFALAGCLSSGWWLAEHGAEIVRYFLDWYGHPRGAIGQLPWSRLPSLIKGYVRELGGGSPGYALTLGAFLALSLADARGGEEPPSLRRINWPFAWMAASPLLVVILLRTENLSYALPAPFGFYLFAVRPLRGARPLWSRIAAPHRLVAVAAVVLVATSFARRMAGSHGARSAERTGARHVAREIARHAEGRSLLASRGVNVATTYWGALNPYSLANVFLFDLGYPVEVARERSGPSRPRAVVIRSAILWQDAVVESAAPATSAVEAMSALVESADYAVVLDRSASHPSARVPFPASWPLWTLLGQRLRDSPVMVPLIETVPITQAEQVVVLARAPPLPP